MFCQWNTYLDKTKGVCIMDNLIKKCEDVKVDLDFPLVECLRKEYCENQVNFASRNYCRIYFAENGQVKEIPKEIRR